MEIVTSWLRTTVNGKLACDSYTPKSRFGLVTCVIHESTVPSAGLISELRTTSRLTSQSRYTENTGDRLIIPLRLRCGQVPKGE